MVDQGSDTEVDVDGSLARDKASDEQREKFIHRVEMHEVKR